MNNSILIKAKAFIISIRPQTTPLGMVSVYVGGLVAGASYNSLNLILAVFATFFVTAASMTFNDFFDGEIDKIHHADRPIPKGIIKPKEMLYFSIIFFAIGLTLSFFINLLCFAIAAISVLLLVIYEKYSKNIGIFSNMTVAFISAISFTFGGAAVENPYSSFILSLMTFFVITGREIIMDIRDIKGDKVTRRSLPIQIGRKNASYVACVFLIVTVILTPIPYLLNILNLWYLIVIIPVGIITLLVIIKMLKDIKNAAKSAQLIRIALAIALVSFIIGIIP